MMRSEISHSTPAPARHEAAGHIHDDPAGRDAAITKMLLRPLPKLEPLPAPEPPKIDAVLTRAAHDLTHVDAALTALGGGDEDIDEMPGYDALEEARDDILNVLSDTPAEGLPGLQAKARAILTRRVTENFEEGQSLGQSLARDLMRSPGWAIEIHPDPIFAAIEETKRLQAAREAAWQLPQPAGNIDPLPEQTATFKAFVAHVDGLLLQTVPTTGTGCAALCRYALEYHAEHDVALDESPTTAEHYRILDLVARSPLLPYAPTKEVESKPDPTPDTEPRDWPAFAAMHPGMVPFPTAKPTFLAALDMAIPLEGQRLLDLANAEIERRRGAYLGHPDPAIWPRVEASLRRDLRVEALTAVSSPERAEPAGDDRSQLGFVLYEDTAGDTRRKPVAEWIAFMAQRLYHIAQNEEIRRSTAEGDDLSPEATKALQDRLRLDLRIDALHDLAFRSREIFEASRQYGVGDRWRYGDGVVWTPECDAPLVRDILDAWAAWSTHQDAMEAAYANGTLPEDEDDEEHLVDTRRYELLNAADALPATRESLLPKALALAWIQLVSEWRRGCTRADYGTNGRLVLDIGEIALALGQDGADATHADAALIAGGHAATVAGLAVPADDKPARSDLADACVEQVERLRLWDAENDFLSEAEADAEIDRWGAVTRRAIEEPSAGPRDLAGKCVLMLKDLDRFFPEDRYGTDNFRLLRVILREAISMYGHATFALAMEFGV